MAFDYTKAFSDNLSSDASKISSLSELKTFLDYAHIKHCLLEPFCTEPNYPVVDLRDLMPSFEADLLEYPSLPGFSLVAFSRSLESFQEIFQYDFLYPSNEQVVEEAKDSISILGDHIIMRNAQSFLSRLPRKYQQSFHEQLDGFDVSMLHNYIKVMPYLMEMDRGHVMAQDNAGYFHLAGIYASFPSDVDGEIKRFGLRMGKFKIGDNALYERNRLFVYQYLMELYGFPIASERRTSATMFARRLHQMGEQFLIRVLGQSDRTITTIWNEGNNMPLQVEKIALVHLDQDNHEFLQQLESEGYFVDAKRQVVLIKTTYMQHKFSPDNVRQDRALSVKRQELIHPLSGQILSDVAIFKDSTTLIVRLNDIANGEFSGRIVYKRNEVVENTDTHEKRLKCLFAWLSKHQRRIIGYSDDFYSSVTRVMESYIHHPDHQEEFSSLKELIVEVRSKYSYIRQARKVRYFEDLRSRNYKGEKIGYNHMLREAVILLHDFKFEMVDYFEVLAQTLLVQAKAMINDRYLHKKYIERPEDGMRQHGLEIKRNYSKLVNEYDELVAICKSRQH